MDATFLPALTARFGSAILKQTEFRDELTLQISADVAHDFFQACRDECGFDYLLDISSLDNFGSDPRWEMVYELYALSNGAHHHLRVKYTVPQSDKAPSVSDLWPTAGWHEREIYDMMGIEFSGLADHRRILMWEGYPYFPLRKDFPLAGRPSEMPDVAFSNRAPLAGGPFVTSPTSATTVDREPRSREIP